MVPTPRPESERSRAAARLLAEIEAWLLGLDPGIRLTVACSGGLDSMVLLHALVKLRDEKGPDLRLAAHHVHHGLMPEADAWAEHVRQHCERWAVPFTMERVRVAARRGRGIEAAARAARYGSYAQLSCDYLALAHHADDQAETVLLQLLRGGGPRVWAAMPRERRLGRVRLVRPLLGLRRSCLQAYAETHDLTWVEDPSNRDAALARNRLRQQVWPALEAAFPDAAERLAQAAREAQEMLELSEQLAALDWAGCARDERLHLASWATLSEVRRRNLLVYWLRQQLLEWPSRAALTEWARQLEQCHQALLLGPLFRTTAEGPEAWQLRAEKGHAWAERRMAASLVSRRLPDAVAAPGSWSSNWGLLRITQITGSATPDDPCIDSPQQHGLAAWSLRHRREADRIRLTGKSGRVPLKNIFQAHGVPARLRAHWPLLVHGDRVIAVVGLAVDSDYRREPRWRLDWQPGNPESLDSFSA